MQSLRSSVAAAVVLVVGLGTACSADSDPRAGTDCQSTLDGHDEIVHSPDVVIADEPIATQKCQLDGVLQHQILSEVLDDGSISETDPFSLLLVDDERQRHGYHDYFVASDRCWREVDEFPLRGERDIWDELALDVGPDRLTLKRRRGWAPGETFYVYDPNFPKGGKGGDTGAPLTLNGSSLGIQVPEPFALDMSSWTDFLDTAVFDARWTPADDGAFVFVHLWVYDVDLQRERYTCTLWDDGHAVLDIGWAAEDLHSVELSVGRITHHIAEVEDVGTIDSAVLRHLRLIAYDLRS